MIGREQAKTRSSWLQATAISLALHGMAVAGAIYQPSLPSFPSGPVAEPEISVEALLPSFTPPETGAPAGAEPVANAPVAPQLPETGPEAILTLVSPEADVLRPLDLAGQSTILTTPIEVPTIALPPQSPLPPLSADSGSGSEPAAPPDLPQGPAGPADPRLAALVERVRAQMDAPCLLGLPQLRDGALGLAVLAPDERQISDFITEVETRLGEPVTSQPVLLDPRQCEGITFLRRTPQYPAFGLPIQLAASEVASGGNVVGRIANGSGAYNTLLLVDDNGVVHDLRRFLIVQGGEVTFDVPMSRAGTARDTSQILIALATTGRIESVTANAGKLAADFFPALAAEVGETALIGVGSVYIR